MIENALVKTISKMPITEFLTEKGYQVEKVGDNVFTVHRSEELPVYMSIDGSTLYFEADLGNISEIASKELYFSFLDLNTEILPVSLGIDTTKADDPHLVLVESREIDNLDDNEILSVLDAIELAIDKLENILSSHIK
ncbi:MAG: CesT family type III secretion system chaperone [Chitinispirillaceae bacterium]|nr:CesT family type III secretion system chaperone [Chitinispirillaceae bacterium]